MGEYAFQPYAYRNPTEAGGVTAGYTEAGLGSAHSMLAAMRARGSVGYPATPQLEGPAETGFYDYTPSSPIQRIQSPDYRLMQGEGAIESGYQGLMGGDYNRLEQALYDPAAAAAKRAYEQSRIDLENAMNARGTYGGSEFARQMTEGVGRTYQETLANAAAQAIAQRYGLQSQEQAQAEQFRQEATRMGLMREQNYNTFMLNQAAQRQAQEQNIWQSNMAETLRSQEYAQQRWAQQAAGAQGAIDFRNQQAMMNYQNEIAARAGGLAEEESAFNRYLALAGLGAPMTSANLQYQAAIQQAQAQRDAAAKAAGASTWGALANTAGQIGGGLLGNQQFMSWLQQPSQPTVYNSGIDWGAVPQSSIQDIYSNPNYGY
jgi:hypothetical protein